MSLMVCTDCSANYLPADACPHCGGGVYRFDWEEEDMPKATVEGGGSDYSEGAPVEPAAAPEPRPKPAPKPKPAPAADDK